MLSILNLLARSYLFISLCLLTYNGAAQELQPIHPKEIDMFAADIEKNIFRLMLTYIGPDINGSPVTFSYEREIRKPFTIILKAGPSFKVSNFGSGGNTEQLCINAFASGELRYYFNLMRRIRKEKTVRNFTAAYLAIEYNLLSDPIARINLSASEGVERS